MGASSCVLEPGPWVLVPHDSLGSSVTNSACWALLVNSGIWIRTRVSARCAHQNQSISPRVRTAASVTTIWILVSSFRPGTSQEWKVIIIMDNTEQCLWASFQASSLCMVEKVLLESCISTPCDRQRGERTLYPTTHKGLLGFVWVSCLLTTWLVHPQGVPSQNEMAQDWLTLVQAWFQIPPGPHGGYVG